MTADRIKEIQNETAFPDSVSVCQALMKVWNECEQQQERMYSESDKIMKFLDTEKELKLSDAKIIERIKWYFETYFEQFKKK